MSEKEEIEKTLEDNPKLKELFELLNKEITRAFYEWYDDSIERGGQKLSPNQQIRYQECFKYGYVRGAILFGHEDKPPTIPGMPKKDRFDLLDIREE